MSGIQPSAFSIQGFLAEAIAALKASAIDNPELDARLLLAHALKLDRVQLLSQSQRILTPDEITRIHALINRRARHESVARIIGMREFWSLPFGLNEATLEPRPDSEILIEATLRRVQESGVRGQDLSSLTPGPQPLAPSILDIGTGTGCLLLSLLHELPHATGLGLDIAERAVQQARENAQRLNLQNRATFRTNNWVDGITEPFDIIISNPPYIVQDVIPALAQEVRDFDAMLALSGGKDGLNAYRHLIPQLPKLLKPKGFVVFEIGYDQAASVTVLFRNAGFANITTHKDLGANDRCIMASID